MRSHGLEIATINQKFCLSPLIACRRIDMSSHLMRAANLVKSGEEENAGAVEDLVGGVDTDGEAGEAGEVAKMEADADVNLDSVIF